MLDNGLGRHRETQLKSYYHVCIMDTISHMHASSLAEPTVAQQGLDFGFSLLHCGPQDEGISRDLWCVIN